MKHLLVTTFLLALPFMAQAQYKSEVWSPDNGDGTYTNPVINADYSDPDVVAVGEDYYLTQLHPRTARPSFQRPGELGDNRACPAEPVPLFHLSATRQWRVGTEHKIPQR
jgi:hypothetical protein